MCKFKMQNIASLSIALALSNCCFVRSKDGTTRKSQEISDVDDLAGVSGMYVIINCLSILAAYNIRNQEVLIRGVKGDR